MARYASGSTPIQIDQLEPETSAKHPALVILYGSGGAASSWIDRFAPTLSNAGIAVYAPHYFDKTGAERATSALVHDGRNFTAWLAAVRDAVSYVASRRLVDPGRIGVLGISLGGYLAIALAIEEKRMRAVMELSGGIPLGWEDRVSSGMAPTLVLHGENDDVVPVAEAHKLQAILEERRVTHEIAIFPGQSHWFSGAAQLEMLMHCTGFLERHLFDGSSLRQTS